MSVDPPAFDINDFVSDSSRTSGFFEQQPTQQETIAAPPAPVHVNAEIHEDSPMQDTAADLKMKSLPTVVTRPKKHPILSLTMWRKDDVKRHSYFNPKAACKTDPPSTHLDMTQFEETTSFRNVSAITLANPKMPIALMGCGRDPNTGLKKIQDKFFNPEYSFLENVSFLVLVDMITRMHPGHRNHCTIVLPNKPVHIYFDLDASVDNAHPEKTALYNKVQGQEPKVQAEVRDKFTTYFNQVFGRMPNLDGMHWETASCAGKFSLHAHIITEAFVNIDHLKAFMTSFIQYAQDQPGETLLFHRHGTQNQHDRVTLSLADAAVYTKNRCFRLVGCCKPGKQPLSWLADPCNQEMSAPPLEELVFRGLISHAIDVNPENYLTMDSVGDSIKKRGRKKLSIMNANPKPSKRAVHSRSTKLDLSAEEVGVIQTILRDKDVLGEATEINQCALKFLGSCWHIAGSCKPGTAYCVGLRRQESDAAQPYIHSKASTSFTLTQEYIKIWDWKCDAGAQATFKLTRNQQDFVNLILDHAPSHEASSASESEDEDKCLTGGFTAQVPGGPAIECRAQTRMDDQICPPSALARNVSSGSDSEGTDHSSGDSTDEEADYEEESRFNAGEGAWTTQDGRDGRTHARREGEREATANPSLGEAEGLHLQAQPEMANHRNLAGRNFKRKVEVAAEGLALSNKKQRVYQEFDNHNLHAIDRYAIRDTRPTPETLKAIVADWTVQHQSALKKARKRHGHPNGRSDLLQKMDELKVPLFGTIVAYLNLYFQLSCRMAENVVVVSLLKEFPDRTREWQSDFMNLKSFETSYNYLNVMIDGKECKIAKMWVNHCACARFDKIVFNPLPDGQVELKQAFNDYNLWKGFKISKVDSQKFVSIGGKQACANLLRPFLRHIMQIWCRNEVSLYNYTLNWMAHCIQKPNQKTGVAIVIRGGKGSGKGIVVNTLGKIYGNDYFFHAQKADDLVGNFNDHLQSSLMCFVDEITFGSDVKGMNILKTFITESHMAVNTKFKSRYQLASYINLIIAGNLPQLVETEGSERRFFCLETDDRWGGSQSTQTAEYFRAIAFTPPELLQYFLSNRDISAFNPKMIPSSKAMRDSKVMSLSLVHAWLYHCLIQGFIIEAPTYERQENETQESRSAVDWERPLQKSAIHPAFSQYCKENQRSKGPFPDSAAFWKILHAAFKPTGSDGNKQESLITGHRTSAKSPNTADDAPGTDGKPLKATFIRFPSLETSQRLFRENVVFEKDWSFDSELPLALATGATLTLELLDAAQRVQYDQILDVMRGRGEAAGPSSDNSPGERSIVFVENLPLPISASLLRTQFEQFGTIKHIRIPVDRVTYAELGSAFVEFVEGHQGLAAIAAMHQREFHGRTIRCSQAKRKAAPKAAISASSSSSAHGASVPLVSLVPVRLETEVVALRGNVLRDARRIVLSEVSWAPDSGSGGGVASALGATEPLDWHACFPADPAYTDEEVDRHVHPGFPPPLHQTLLLDAFTNGMTGEDERWMPARAEGDSGDKYPHPIYLLHAPGERRRGRWRESTRFDDAGGGIPRVLWSRQAVGVFVRLSSFSFPVPPLLLNSRLSLRADPSDSLSYALAAQQTLDAVTHGGVQYFGGGEQGPRDAWRVMQAATRDRDNAFDMAVQCAGGQITHAELAHIAAASAQPPPQRVLSSGLWDSLMSAAASSSVGAGAPPALPLPAGSLPSCVMLQAGVHKLAYHAPQAFSVEDAHTQMKENSSSSSSSSSSTSTSSLGCDSAPAVVPDASAGVSVCAVLAPMPLADWLCLCQPLVVRFRIRVGARITAEWGQVATLCPAPPLAAAPLSGPTPILEDYTAVSVLAWAPASAQAHNLLAPMIFIDKATAQLAITWVTRQDSGTQPAADAQGTAAASSAGVGQAELPRFFVETANLPYTWQPADESAALQSMSRSLLRSMSPDQRAAHIAALSAKRGLVPDQWQQVELSIGCGSGGRCVRWCIDGRPQGLVSFAHRPLRPKGDALVVVGLPALPQDCHLSPVAQEMPSLDAHAATPHEMQRSRALPSRFLVHMPPSQTGEPPGSQVRVAAVEMDFSSGGCRALTHTELAQTGLDEGSESDDEGAAAGE